ncbi:MAG: hypothetical protein EXS16_19685 [Gemmataceae bacterium]|nr:hypothetical protein [Gemmataceae bacterium]
MRWTLPFFLACGFIIFSSNAGFTQDKKKDKKGKFDPPPSFQPTDEQLAQIKAKTAHLAAKIAELHKDKKQAKLREDPAQDLLPDVEIYLRGAENIVRFKEFYDKASVKWTLDSLDRGMLRAEQLAKGETPWTKLATSNVLRAYRSDIDGTAQPYGVTYPLNYGKDPEKLWRVDVVLHGRNGKLTEVAFLNAHNGSKKPAADQDWVQLDIFGRGNNAYRWAGESDVLEALGAFLIGEPNAGRVGAIHRKFVVRGFSMGGAGTWHLGLHHPDLWCVMGPGAGFTTTHGYAWKGKKDLPDYQERCLRIYDVVDYVENARMIPIVAYSGGDDAQKLAADNIENRLKELKIDAMTHLVAPGVGHTFIPDYFKKANALWSKHAADGRPINPKKVSFVTYTTSFPSCEWINIFGLEKHYEKASIDAELTAKGCRIITKNLRGLRLELPPSKEYLDKKDKAVSIAIDGEDIKTEGFVEILEGKVVPTTLRVFLVKETGKWRAVPGGRLLPKAWENTLKKVPALQGPIDDAFASGFTCVIGSGPTWHPGTQKFVDAKVAAFKYDWAKHWRGELPTTGDYAVNPNDIKDKHLILFGDPSSNLTLAQILPKLPLKWTKEGIEFAGKKYGAADHVPVMIFPNPLNPHKYVVLNTGHTIPSEDYTKTNAMLYPRLGDYAILRMTPTAKNAAAYEVATAGLFDEFWRIEKK